MSATSPYGTVTVAGQPVYRGGSANPPAPHKFNFTSLQMSFAWGSDGAEATIIYDFASVPVTTGYNLTIEAGGHTLWGVCVSDAPRQSSGGNSRELKFKDLLLYLTYDQVYCSFNKLDDHIVNGQRAKRYVHHIPDLSDSVTLTPNTGFQVDNNLNILLFGSGQLNGANEFISQTTLPAGPYFSGFIKTYTTAPLTAAQIITIILNSTTVKDTWTCTFHPDQFNYPVYDIDAAGGKSLQAILQEISDAQGLVFAQMGAPLNLYWVRKGQLDSRYPPILSLTPPLETNPSTGALQLLTDDRIEGDALSGHPTQVQILGDRNTYLVLNIPLVPGWSPGWEAMWSVDLFRNDIYQRGVTNSVVTSGTTSWPVGTPFINIGYSAGDPEAVIAKQLANALAAEITVAQYALLRGETPFSISSLQNPVWCDYLKYAGKSRLDMPAELYINQILLRAFQFPDGFQITNQQGVMIPLDSLEIMDKLIARVTYDPKSGEMTANPLVAADGNGLAITLGYQVGEQMFSKLNPARFNLAEWNNAQDIWANQEFTIDDSGEPGGKVVLFNEPIIKSASLVKIIDGYGVLNASPVKADGVTPGFDIPQVQIGCCFSAERYSFFSSALPGGKVETIQIGGLNREVICVYGQTSVSGYAEVLYSDGLTADQKARQYVAPLELLQYIYDKGGYRHVLIQDPTTGAFPAGMQLNPFIDKVSVKIEPNAPIEEIIDYTTELPPQKYTPERDLDRNVKLLTLIPGQAQLRNEAIVDKLIASALQVSKDSRQTLENAFKGFFFADDQPTSPVTIGTSNATTTLPVGTAVWKLPLIAATSDTPARNTTAVFPTNVTAAHKEFAGVAVRTNELVGAARSIQVQNTGDGLALVLLPAKFGDALYKVVGKYYLSNVVNGTPVAVFAQQDSLARTTPVPPDQRATNPDGATLCKVQFGAISPPAAASNPPFEIQKVSETQVAISNNSVILQGLDCQTMVPIDGLGQPFTVSAGEKIYLEVLFDLNGNPIMANIAHWPAGWGQWTHGIVGEQFPALAGVVDKTNIVAGGTEEANLTEAMAVYVEPSGNGTLAFAEAWTAMTKFVNLTPRYTQFYAWYLIGYCTDGPQTGFSMAGSGAADAAFTVVQSLDSHLMLQGFCQGGVPCKVPMPYSGVFEQMLPEPTFTQAGAVVKIIAPGGYADVAVRYSIDGGEWVEYTGTITADRGAHKILAYATLVEYVQSKTATFSFTV